jgi:hypothetical protein
MDTTTLVQSILTSLWIISTALAVQLRAAGKAQRRALKKLRDRDIMWSIYCHALRQIYAADTGKSPLPVPDKLEIDDYDDIMGK